MSKIVIDAGHGGRDSGAVGPTGLKESIVVLDIAKLVEVGLNKLGLQMRLTRDGDVFVELSRRCRIANEWGANLFISIHLNSDGPTAHGIETLYKTTAGKNLAAPIQVALITATGERDRGLKSRDNLAVLNGTRMPACLAEVGFVSNKETETKFRTLTYKSKIAYAICAGLESFLGLELAPPIELLPAEPESGGNIK